MDKEEILGVEIPKMFVPALRDLIEHMGRSSLGSYYAVPRGQRKKPEIRAARIPGHGGAKAKDVFLLIQPTNTGITVKHHGKIYYHFEDDDIDLNLRLTRLKEQIDVWASEKKKPTAPIEIAKNHGPELGSHFESNRRRH